MNDLDNVVTVGEIVADYLRRLEVRRELEKLLFSGCGSPEACASQEQGTSSKFRGEKHDKIQRKNNRGKTRIKS